MRDESLGSPVGTPHHLQRRHLRGEDLGTLADELQRDLDAAGAGPVPDLAERAGAELADKLSVESGTGRLSGCEFIALLL
jgi:hypothetical protein